VISYGKASLPDFRTMIRWIDIGSRVQAKNNQNKGESVTGEDRG
jgi:hypothetical protein